MGKRKRKAKRSPENSTRTQPARHSPSTGRRKLFIGSTLVALGVGAIAIFALFDGSSSGASSVNVEVPELSALAQRGARSFEAKCSQCHGTNAAGSDNGPPLVHRIYEPSHHGDAAFGRAVRFGVRPHHWQFGAMPRIAVSDRELSAIITYVRELQRANGIR